MDDENLRRHVRGLISHQLHFLEKAILDIGEIQDTRRLTFKGMIVSLCSPSLLGEIILAAKIEQIVREMARDSLSRVQ
jgi:hypothetical protein